MESEAIPAGMTREQVLEAADAIMRGTLMDRLGLEWVDIRADRVVARLPVAGNTQPYGLLHGGATAALCETVGSVGAAVAAGLERRPVGVQLSINHLRAVRDGFVTATGVPVHVGRTLAVWDVRVDDDGGRQVATGRLTVSFREGPRGEG